MIRSPLAFCRRVIDAATILFVLAVSISSRGDDSLQAPSKSDPDARVVKQTYRVTIFENGKGEYTFTRRVKILSQRGVEQCRVSVSGSKFLKVSDISGQVFDKNGLVTYTLTKDEIQHICGFEGYALYSDICYDHFELSAGSFPFEIEYSYKVRFSSLFFWPAWDTQEDIPIDSSSYILNIPSTVEFKTSPTGEIPQPKVSKSEKGDQYVWLLTNIPAFEDETAMPPESNYELALRFAPTHYKLEDYQFNATSWETLSRDYFLMARESFKTSQSQDDMVREVTGLSSDALRNYRELHRLLSHKSRYVEVASGIGGWKPHVSEETFANGYGDCKDLATMYASMVKEKNTFAHLAIVRTKDLGDIDRQFPALDVFNHMIFYVVNGVDTIWHDATCFDCEFGDLPEDDEDIYVLAIDSSKGALVRTPASKPADNLIVRTATLNISDDLSLLVHERIAVKGNPSLDLKYLSENSSERDFGEYLKSRGGIVSRNLQIDKCSVDKTEAFSMLSCSVNGRVPRYMRRVNMTFFFDQAIIPPFEDAELVRLDKRHYPIELDYPRVVIDTMTIISSAAFKLRSLPDSATVSSEFGTLKVTYRAVADTVTVIRQRESDRYQINPEEFEKFNAYRETLYKELLKSLVFEKVK